MGYFMQIEADSGESRPNKVFWAVFTGVISYLIAFLILILLKNKIKSVPQWIILGVSGSVLFAFNRGVISYFITNLSIKGSRTYIDYFFYLLPFMSKKLSIGIFLYSFLILFLLFIVRFIVYPDKKALFNEFFVFKE